MLDTWTVRTKEEAVMPHSASRVDGTGDDTRVVWVRDVAIGGSAAVVMAGPCSVESRDQVTRTAHAVRDMGAVILRGGAYKPRTSPYDFQGLGVEGLRLLRKAGDEADMPVVTEVMSEDDVAVVCDHADMLQVGARNMQNFALLAELGRVQRPVLLKRGLSATVTELLMAAEYIMAHGNTQIIVCERGIRTFENATRNTLDISAIPVIKRESHLPVIVDPSHAGGDADLVLPLSLAAIAVGADGLIIEVHPDPESALSDGDQSLTFSAFDDLMTRLGPIIAATERSLSVAPAEAALALA